MKKDFGGVVWTNHALARMRERGIKQGDAWATFRRPDQTKNAKIKGAWVYYRTFPTSPRLRGASGNQKIEVVAKKDPLTGSGQAGKWVIMSVWSKPVFGSKKKVKSLWKLIFERFFKRKK